MEQKKAEENYEDAIAGGHFVMLMNIDKDKQDMYSLNLGNIYSGEFITVQLVIL